MRNPRPVTVPELLALARGWLGVPFAHQGRSFYGVDCGGFVVMVARSAGIVPADYEDPTGYGRRATPDLRNLVLRHCRRTPRAEPGCLVLIRWPGDFEAGHVAICTGPTLIHASLAARRVVECSYRDPWLRMTHSLYRLPNVIYQETNESRTTD